MESNDKVPQVDITTPIVKVKKKVGRKKKVIFTKKILQKVTEDLAAGFTQASIAQSLGYSPTHWFALAAQNPELSEAITAGNVKVEQLLVSKLQNIVNDINHKKNYESIIFMLKSKFKWADTQKQDIIINTPPADLKVPDYRLPTPEEIEACNNDQSDDE